MLLSQKIKPSISISPSLARDMAGHDGDVAVMAVAEDEARRRRRQAERVALPAGMVLVQLLTVGTMLLSTRFVNPAFIHWYSYR